MAFKLEITDSAYKDLDGILSYLEESLFATSAALRFADKLEECYKRILGYPRLYPMCRNENIAARGFRCAVVMRYVVFYTVDDVKAVIHIQRIIHGTMDYPQTDM